MHRIILTGVLPFRAIIIELDGGIPRNTIIDSRKPETEREKN